MNVLITSASRKVSLVRAFQQALAQEGGGKVIAADASSLAPALYCADEHCLTPADSAPGFLGAMLRLCREREVRLLIPPLDEELPSTPT
jgi:carbamoyl-phosphate synthase large subunit